MPESTDPRVFFAAERTMLAWLRTGLAVIGVGFLVARFGLFLRMLQNPSVDVSPPTASTLIGVGFVCLGAGMIAISAWQHSGFISGIQLSQQPQRYSMRLALWASAIVATLGVLLSGYLLLSLFT